MKTLGLLIWLTVETLPGQAVGQISGRAGSRVALPVALKGLTAAVVAPAVELDDDPFGGEQDVDLVPGYVDVDLRGGKAVLADPEEELVLEV